MRDPALPAVPLPASSIPALPVPALGHPPDGAGRKDAPAAHARARGDGRIPYGTRTLPGWHATRRGARLNGSSLRGAGLRFGRTTPRATMRYLRSFQELD